VKLNRTLSLVVDFVIVPICYVIISFLIIPIILINIDLITTPETEHIIITDKKEEITREEGVPTNTPSINKKKTSDDFIQGTDADKEENTSSSTVIKIFDVNIPRIEELEVDTELIQLIVFEPIQDIKKVVRPATRESCGRPWITPLLEAQGEIKKVEYRRQPGTGLRGLHLDVETTDEQYIVIHVFPEQLTKQCSDLFKFTTGEVVSVSGSEFLTKAKTQKNICATEIIRDSGILKLRNLTTGDLEQDECCEIMCKKNCAGKPLMCRKICMNRCTNIL
jgi:hypothetical protein